jgi:hypothetical protein
MSMTTMTKNNTTKKKGRWQAALLAGLVLAGSVAVPQAADAATKSTTCSKWQSSSDCAVWVTPKGHLNFSIKTDSNQTHRFTVRAPSGKLLSSGMLRSGERTEVYLAGHTGKVKITIQDRWGVQEKIVASY